MRRPVPYLIRLAVVIPLLLPVACSDSGTAPPAAPHARSADASDDNMLTWTTVAPAGELVTLNKVWAGSPTEVFAVGVGGRIRHYDGSSWATQSSGTTANLMGVWGASPTEVFAVGLGGTIRHFDGTAWTAQASGTTGLLFGVWGTSGSDVFAVGTPTIIRHYNGTSWTPMAVPGAFGAFVAVYGFSSADVFAA